MCPLPSLTDGFVGFSFSLFLIFSLTRSETETIFREREKEFFSEREKARDFMDAYALHLAMAALVGASFVAVSAYYMHRKTLTQLLEFAKTVEREREREDNSDAGGGDSPQHLKKRRSYARRKGNNYYRRGSASLPDVTAISGVIDGEDRRNGPVPVDGIPPGLPRLHTLPEGTDLDFSSE